MSCNVGHAKSQLSTVLLLIIFLRLKPLRAAVDLSHPCDYAETVNITTGLRLKDGSYSYDGLLIPANMTALYNFHLVDGILQYVPSHMRGCACRQRPCITFCCPPNKVFDDHTQSCVQQTLMVSDLQQRSQFTHIDVTNANGKVNVFNIHDMFVMRYEIGCNRKYIDKYDELFWKWDLFGNGSLLSLGHIWNNDEYCFTPLEHKKVWSLVPLTCEHSLHGFRLWIYVICLFVAILFYIFTLVILVSIKAVRNGGYGESLIFYLASTIVGLSALLYLALNSRWDISEAKCRNIGFIAYVFLMFSFFLLTTISWNFWYNFNSKRLSSWKRKLIYLFAIALAVTLRFILKFIQDSDVYQPIKPGIGDKFCWFDGRLWGILLYFYIPILICLGFCMIFFLKAYILIWSLSEDTLNVAGYDIKLLKAHFFAFFSYLLGVLCVWLRELVAYMTFRLRGQYFVTDFLTGICLLALSVCGLILLLYKNPLVRLWWHVNVTFYMSPKREDRPGNDAYLQKTYREVEQAEIDELSELRNGYKD